MTSTRTKLRLSVAGSFSYLNPADPSKIRTSVYDRRRTFNAWNPSISINYKPRRKFSAYASFTTGTKAGGFNDQEKTGIAPENGFATASFEYDSEKARNFEVCAKLSLGHARFNVAAFHAKYKNLQASQAQQNGSIRTTNAASATAKGIEADASLLLAPGLTIRAATSPTYTPAVTIIRDRAAHHHARLVDLQPRDSERARWPARCGAGLHRQRQHRLRLPDQRAPRVAYPRPRLLQRWRAIPVEPRSARPRAKLLAPRCLYRGWSIALSGKNLADKAIRGFSGLAATPLFGTSHTLCLGLSISTYATNSECLQQSH
ncbi:TonB-dependent receptor [Bradyrhizobium sp. Leo170]|uniref:TonB-dependent receptor domain-containing protein n=1 Tax=Bradyrhizobium sp. Leo170 TaxID=1571199 RepID=UPI0013EEE44D|nr:TonB-dependent receptor [Bradyrhizobium sp. Leo170]